MTFVRVALSLERLASGDVAVIRLAQGEATANVTRSLGAHGHVILETQALTGGDAGLTLLTVQRK